MKWLLIVIVLNEGSFVGVNNAGEFNNKVACENAGRDLLIEWDVAFKCYPTGSNRDYPVTQGD